MARFITPVLVQDTTDCTATNTGSIQTKGGLYVAMQSRIGGILNVTDSTASTTTLNGAIVTPGGVGCGTLSVGAVPNLPSQTAKTFFAAPNGSAGSPTFRAIQGSDVPVFVASGASHAVGAVPDPGATAGTTKFLREDATWAVPPGGSGMTNPMTTLGDMIYGASGGAPTRLAGNTSTVKQHLTSTGNGSAAAAPLWSDFSGDVQATVLSTFVAGTNTAVVNTDTVAQAFGKVQAQISAGGGGGTTWHMGTATLDFGTHQGLASIAITGQTGILAGSQIQVTLQATASATKAAEEIYMDPIVLSVSAPTAGTGFTIFGSALGRYVSGQYNISWAWA